MATSKEHKSGLERELDSVRDFVRGLRRLDTDAARLRALSFAWAQAFDEREAEATIALGYRCGVTVRARGGRSMTAHRIVIYAPLFIAVLLIVLFVIAPLPAHAQSSPAADTILLPVVTHATGWATEVNLTNFTGDAITVSAWFTPVNESDNDPNRMADTRLGPHERKTIEIGSLGISGTGTLILEGCRVRESCVPVLAQFQPGHRPFMLMHLPRRYRDISASVRIYATGSVTIGGNAVTATRGDSYLAIPYWATSRLSDGPVDLPWIESDAKHSTTIGIVNASSYSTITLRITLFDGLGVKRGERDETLCALCNVRRSAESMFPALAATNRANRQPAGAGWWVRVEQIGSEPNEWAAGEKAVADVESCFNGCAQFIAYASVMDSSFVATPCPPKQACVPDVHFIMPQSEVAGAAPSDYRDAQSVGVAALRVSGKGVPIVSEEAQRALTIFDPTMPCSIVVRPGNIEITDYLGQTVTVPNIRMEDWQGGTIKMLTREELMRMPPQICGPTHVETVVRLAGATGVER
jgi:hypothetical protein